MSTDSVTLFDLFRTYPARSVVLSVAAGATSRSLAAFRTESLEAECFEEHP